MEAVLEQAADLQKRGRWPEAEAVLERAPSLLGTSAPAGLRERVSQAQADAAMANTATGPVSSAPSNLFGTPATACLPPAPIGPAEKPQAPFTPYMLGDFVGFVANSFADLKIAEGESPRPTDRLFLEFNYYNDVNKTAWTNPIQPIHNVDLFRYTFGMEKTFFDERVSVGLRVPFYALDAEGKEFHSVTDP